MKKVAVVGFDKKPLEKELKKHGYILEKLKPDFVVSFGGDGSALMAEQLYSEVPRLAIKHSKTCKKCTIGEGHDFSGIIEKLKKKRYKIVEEHKVEGRVNNDKHKVLVALNEINVAHAIPIRAIRFDVSVDGKPVETQLIGDGAIVATPYGSTAYFYIIAGRSFSDKLGIAFNNVNKKIKYRLADLDSSVKIHVNRGPAFMCADNNTTMIPLRDGDTITVKLSKQKAKIIELEGEKRKIEI